MSKTRGYTTGSSSSSERRSLVIEVPEIAEDVMTVIFLRKNGALKSDSFSDTKANAPIS